EVVGLVAVVAATLVLVVAMMIGAVAVLVARIHALEAARAVHAHAVAAMATAAATPAALRQGFTADRNRCGGEGPGPGRRPGNGLHARLRSVVGERPSPPMSATLEAPCPMGCDGGHKNAVSRAVSLLRQTSGAKSD